MGEGTTRWWVGGWAGAGVGGTFGGIGGLSFGGVDVW